MDGAALIFLQTIAGVYFLGITGVGVFLFREIVQLRDQVRGLAARYRQLDEMERFMEQAGVRSLGDAGMEHGS